MRVNRVVDRSSDMARVGCALVALLECLGMAKGDGDGECTVVGFMSGRECYVLPTSVAMAIIFSLFFAAFLAGGFLAWRIGKQESASTSPPE